MTISRLFLTLTLSLTSLSGFADSIRCVSDNVTIHGHVVTQYKTMGRSTFTGNLFVQIYKHSEIISAANVFVNNGNIQDQSIFFLNQKDSEGHHISLSVNSSEVSTIKVDDETIQFAPYCEIKPDIVNSPPTICKSNFSLGRMCGLVGDECICHQHNGH